ncbi:hypothetical protein LMG33818_001899 [Halomonadaceae bacterium LMG 33818]|uniref:protease inhibitor I42 family protein n=1 Tax=Cernens ardua TaxID=3402176 RepID=UPI003EDC522B
MRFGCRSITLLALATTLSALSGCAVLNSQGATQHAQGEGAHRQSGLKIGNAALPAFAQTSGNTADSSSASDPYADAGSPEAIIYTREPYVVVRPGDTAHCRRLVVPVGKTVSVRLPANTKSGLAWQLDNRPSGLALLTAPKAEQRDSSDTKLIAGSKTDVVYDWRFKGESRGHGVLRLLYHNPNAQQEAAKRTFQCGITVE